MWGVLQQCVYETEIHGIGDLFSAQGQRYITIKLKSDVEREHQRFTIVC